MNEGGALLRKLQEEEQGLGKCRLQQIQTALERFFEAMLERPSRLPYTEREPVEFALPSSSQKAPDCRLAHLRVYLHIARTAILDCLLE